MSEQTKIAWCDSTVNFWEGCTKVSDGCKNCYAEARDKRFAPKFVGINVPDGAFGKPRVAPHWGKGAERRKSKSAVKDALSFNRKPWVMDTGSTIDKPTCHRRRIFSLSLGDWLDEEVPIEWLAEMLDTIRQCSDVTWILCTKRPENWTQRLEAVIHYQRHRRDDKFWFELHQWCQNWISGKAPAHIVLLTSVENQEQADKRIPELLGIPAVCRGLSLEPLLGPVMLEGYDAQEIKHSWLKHYDGMPDIDWLIIGGESGANARPCNVEWIRSLVAQGKAAGVATFVKQLGSQPVRGEGDEPFEYVRHIRKHGYDHHEVVTYDKKGGDPSEWPADLRVQEWPKGF